ncbi:ArgP/LysG family DNA-binding transcriptional regulator [Parendozoicomonas haliclonae]|uniref:Putative HTH-type transcriptional regulator n=1 Tax=Parendozoicomonas haliclonae TaxID=1960125 RepID=A0A1X7ANS9_9GAMM|nr:ArgP/LysG family DNA-binding transcriptional regulator [Parendozoicomonas haliclonae]SMA49758.1 putative HTH-type transcriptional regulator [Parendozoicomonas haliclonae]
MLDHKELETLVAIIDCGSFEAAARRLHISPGAVSQRIKGLENRVGQPLLVRRQPPVATEVGSTVLQHARKVLLLQDEVEAALWPAASSQGHSVSVAINHDSLNCWFMVVVMAVQKDVPVNFDIRTMDNRAALEQLKRGEVMGAITSVVQDVPGCRSRVLGRLGYVAVCSTSFHQRYFSQGLHADSLSHAPYLCHDRCDDLADAVLARYQASQTLANTHYIPSTPMIADAVAQGLGWGMLPSTLVEKHPAREQLIVLDGPEVNVELHWKRWDIQSDTLAVIERHLFAVARACLNQGQSD